METVAHDDSAKNRRRNLEGAKSAAYRTMERRATATTTKTVIIQLPCLRSNNLIKTKEIICLFHGMALMSYWCTIFVVAV